MYGTNLPKSLKIAQNSKETWDFLNGKYFNEVMYSWAMNVLIRGEKYSRISEKGTRMISYKIVVECKIYGKKRDF